MEKFIDAECKLNDLFVAKNILSEDEKKLLILCSSEVRRNYLDYSVKIDEWNPKHKIEYLLITSHMLSYQRTCSTLSSSCGFDSLRNFHHNTMIIWGATGSSSRSIFRIILSLVVICSNSLNEQ